MELAFLTAIRRLPGRQRAVLILRDVLGWTGPEVADLLDTTVAAANSALQRARATIEQRAARPPPGGAGERGARARCTATSTPGSGPTWTALVALLHEDAVLRMPPGRTVFGGAAAIEFMRANCPGGHVEVTSVNGRPAVSLPGHSVTLFEVADGRVAALEAFLYPE